MENVDCIVTLCKDESLNCYHLHAEIVDGSYSEALHPLLCEFPFCMFARIGRCTFSVFSMIQSFSFTLKEYCMYTQ